MTGKNAPTGTITIYDGATALVSYPLLALFQGNVIGLVLPPLNVGTHFLTAIYSGDANYAPGQSAAVAVTVIAGPLQLSIQCSSTKLTLGQTLSCAVTASQGPFPSTGKVIYSSTNGASGTVTLSNSGTGTITFKPNMKESYVLTLNYAAQGNYQAASVPGVSYTVN